MRCLLPYKRGTQGVWNDVLLQKRNIEIPDVPSPTRRLSGIVYADSISIGSYEIRSDNSEMLLSIDALWPKNSLVTNLFGYTQVLSKYNKTELYRYNDFDAPSVFNLKSSNSYRHLTLTHKKENLVRDIDVEDVFYVVEYDYTDTKEPSSSELLQEDYKKCSEMFPVVERIRVQLARVVAE